MSTTSIDPNGTALIRVGSLVRRCPSLIRNLGRRTYQITLVSRDPSVEEHVRTAARTLADGIGYQGEEPFSVVACDATVGSVVMLEFAYGGARSPSGSQASLTQTHRSDAVDGRSQRLRRRRKPFRAYAKRIVIAYAAFYVVMQLVQASSASC